MTGEERSDRYRDVVGAEVTALERDIRAHVVDLEEAFALRDWGAVARIYRAVAALAERLELLDPEARSRVLARVDAEQAAIDERAVDVDAIGADLEDPDEDDPEGAGRDGFSFDRGRDRPDDRPRWMR